MNMQESINVETASKIADAMRRVVDTWPDLKCSGCIEVRPFIVTDVQIDHESQIWNIDKKPFRVRGLQRLPAPGWVELNVEGTQNGLSTRTVYCPKCAKGRVI